MTAKSPRLCPKWRAIHHYTGLILGIVFAIIGLTGSILVYYLEIDEWLNAAKSVSSTDKTYASYQSIWDAIQASEPNRQHAWRLEIPETPEQTITARYYKPAESTHQSFAPLMLSINPYTSEIISKRLWGHYLLTWIYDLHYTLLLDATGKLVMAIVGLLLAVVLMTGVYLWWPSLSKIVSALSVKKTRNPQRLIYDLHKISGIYPFIILQIVTFTGIALEIPQYINPLIHYISPLEEQNTKPLSTLNSQNHPITIDQAVTIAERLFPNAKLCWIETPDGELGTYRINLRQSFEPNRRFPKTNIWIDQYSGEVLQMNDPAHQSAGNTLLNWLHPLHNGEAFGSIGRGLVFVSGFACPILFVTGILRSHHKKQAKRLKQTRSLSAPN
ncbi:PepSY-associated TM helix domain-containing protein [Methylomonas sp. AM2-LC]|uniref:PepSY-associated TM helix domain-containing protein n=1 Tax=Methylomonas sp. AM2-LC TaxID=3153301 RepID=UPI003266A2EB